jgi:hypothetical protein
VDVGFRKQLELIIADFNKANNPSGVPWKEKRPNPDESLDDKASNEQAFFLKPYVFEHPAVAAVVHWAAS